MYLIEGSENGFSSIPISIYWAIVTLTTVGYGDIAPQTVAGQSLAAFIMILGYAIIAVPTGIVTSEISHQKKIRENTQHCSNCATYGHEQNANYCKNCGSKM
jgi:voltage-gated potassium channel